MGRKVQTIIDDETLWQAEMNGYKDRLFRDAIMDAHRLLVEPEIESETLPTHYAIETVCWESWPWINTWWARFLRWIHHRNVLGIHLRLPLPIAWIAHGKRPIVDFVRRDMPRDLLERVRVQRFELERRAEHPTLVLAGRDALYEIQRHPELMRWGCGALGRSGITVFGLELRHSPWLSPDAVVVI